MTRARSLTSIGLAAAAIAALAVAGCGGGGGGNASASTSHPKTATGNAATVGVASTDLGKVLVDSQGRTLYLFAKDRGTTSACTGACATAWPPLRASGKPVAGSGAQSSLLGTTKRSDGKPEVTYNGHPLYLYVGDQKAGDTSGQGITAFGGGWYALTASGGQVTATASGSGGGNGY
jgi:predicted lipoprotein with Yx(FWY)xxD motif